MRKLTAFVLIRALRGICSVQNNCRSVRSFKYCLIVANTRYIFSQHVTLKQKAVTMNLTAQQKLLDLFGRQSVVRSRDLEQYEIPRVEISRLCKRGVVERVGRGIYRLTDAQVTEYQTLAEVGKAIPNGVVCLLSALRFHDLTTQAPFEVWMAIDVKAHLPRTSLPIKFVRFSGPALSDGVETHRMDGVDIKVYCLAKTVADCFKYRHKIGLDVALEALRESRKSNRCTIDDLWRYAKVCRVSNVMMPYMEAMAI